MALFRKLLRRTFYTAAAVSTLLLLATLILWPVSYYRHVSAAYGIAGSAEYWLEADSGRAGGGYVSSPRISPGWQFGVLGTGWNGWSYMTWNTPESPLSTSGSAFLGVRWIHTAGSGWTDDLVLIPFSYLSLLFSILPLLAFRSIRRRRKLSRVGLCTKCGYDLRAHGPGEKCPECGTVVATAPRP